MSKLQNFQNCIIILLVLRNTVFGQIDWAEDDDDPGKSIFHLKSSCPKKIQLKSQKLKHLTSPKTTAAKIQQLYN